MIDGPQSGGLIIGKRFRSGGVRYMTIVVRAWCSVVIGQIIMMSAVNLVLVVLRHLRIIESIPTLSMRPKNGQSKYSSEGISATNK